MLGMFTVATLSWILILSIAAVVGLKVGLGEGISETRRTLSLIGWSRGTISELETALESGADISDINREILYSDHEPRPRVSIVGPDGRVLLESEGELEGEQLSASDVLELIPAGDPAEPIPGTGQQIRVDGELWGYFIITFPEGAELYRFVSEPDRLGTAISHTMATGLVLSLLAVYASFYLFARRLVQPLQQLAFQVSRIGEGELPSQQEWPERGDEIGLLAGALNRMTEALARSNEQLRREDEKRRLMVSGLGHDLRTPVTAIVSHAEAIESGAASDPERSLSTIRRRADHIHHLVDDLLAYAAIGRSTQSDTTRLDIAELARETIISMLPRFEEHGITVEADIPDDPVFVFGARRAIQRSFDNILSNTLEHATNATLVRVSVDCTLEEVRGSTSDDGPEVVRVSISDDGPGIPKDVDIFEPFKKGSPSRSGHGSGLGLSVVREIIEAHGGRCGAERRHSGGSMVWFELTRCRRQTVL